ncbi:mitochondrial ribosomal protein S35 [Leptinotarsa decemlineata]|uniref:mitochondrial ribosomal protein S35 n=1 Tax=Leptinotarsa decemlineata TaxID=7539 RepID=UPI003D309514
MLAFTRNIEVGLSKHFEKSVVCWYSNLANAEVDRKDEFRVLNLKNVKGQIQQRKPQKQLRVLPPRTNQMPVDQDWGNVWPGPRSFHPATVPLPVRQGYVEKGAPPDKFANAELIKIPNFLHLTPPVIKRQCEALKKFCTPWPKALNNEETCQKHFPIEVISSDYCHSSPSIRDPLSRIVTVRFKLSSLKLNARAKDKFLRLIGERYNEENDTVTIVTDRCPLKKQNYDYAMYLITALYHESWKVEPWEKLKSEADMEHYDWEKSKSKTNVEAIFGQPAEKIENIEEYSEAVNKLMNEGESEYAWARYNEVVRKLLKLPAAPS